MLLRSMSLCMHLVLPAEAMARAGPAGHATPGVMTTAPLVVDSEGQASAVLLRDVHCGLLRAYESRSIQARPALRLWPCRPDCLACCL